MNGPVAGALRICSVSAANIRGLQHDELSFKDYSGAAKSTLILGDNGTGKSSFLDAIQFCLTGLDPVLAEAGRSTRLELRNLLSGEHCESSVTVELSDGRTIVSRPTARNRLDDFNRVRMLVKRDLLLAFARGNDEQRGGLVKSLVNLTSSDDGPSGREVELIDDRRQLQDRYGRLADELGELLGVSAEELPGPSSREVQIFRTSMRITRKQISRGRRADDGRDATQIMEMGEALQESVDSLERFGNRLASARRLRLRKNVIEILVRASDLLNESFQEIVDEHVKRVVKKIELSQVADRGDVRLSVILHNGDVVPASSVLSEAALDLAALLSVLALARDGAKRGQAKVLMLDDVLHSIDAVLRDRVASYLFTEFIDWQLIIAFHDRMWFERFSDVAKSIGFEHVTRRIWRGVGGVTCVGSGYRSSRSYLHELLHSGDSSLVPSIATRALEEVAESLSLSMKCSVYRNEGDKYTLGDLWDGIRARATGYQAWISAMDKVDSVKHLRNLVGGHSTSWAENFTDAEARRFGLAVLELVDLVSCDNCGSTVRYKRSGPATCRCGRVMAR